MTVMTKPIKFYRIVCITTVAESAWETFTNKKKALAALKLMVKQIKEAYKDNPEKFNYAKLYSCNLVNDDEAQEEIEGSLELLWMWDLEDGFSEFNLLTKQ